MASAAAIKAGEAYVEISTRDSALVKGLNTAQRRLKGFASSVAAIGTRMVAIGGAATALIAGAVNAFANAGSELVDLSQRTGLSVEALSELGAAARQSGTDMTTLEKGVKKMQDTIATAVQGNATAIASLERLGLKVSDLQKMTGDQQLAAFADALDRIKDPALKTGAALDIFGLAGTKLLPLFEGGSAGVDKLRAKMRALGLTWTTETAVAAEAFGDTLQLAWEMISKVGIEIGAALLPQVQALTEWVIGVTANLIAWIKENQELVVTLSLLAVGTLALGTLLLALSVIALGLSAAITVATTALTIFGAVVTFLSGPIGWIIMGVTLLTGALLYFTGAFGKALDWVKGKLAGLATQTKLTAGEMKGVGVGKGAAGVDAAMGNAQAAARKPNGSGWTEDGNFRYPDGTYRYERKDTKSVRAPASDVDVAGTFNYAVAGRIGANSLAKKQLDASQEIAANTERAAEALTNIDRKLPAQFA